MEGELVRQTEILFGKVTTRVLKGRARNGPAAGDLDTPPATEGAEPRPIDRPSPRVAAPASTSAAPDVPPIVRLRMTAGQQRRLWRHVQSIDGFWESLKETEPGI